MSRWCCEAACSSRLPPQPPGSSKSSINTVLSMTAVYPTRYPGTSSGHCWVENKPFNCESMVLRPANIGCRGASAGASGPSAQPITLGQQPGAERDSGISTGIPSSGAETLEYADHRPRHPAAARHSCSRTAQRLRSAASPLLVVQVRVLLTAPCM